MSYQEFIQQVISGDATNASETFKNLLSKKVYESLNDKKIELGTKFFNESSDEEDYEDNEEITEDNEEITEESLTKGDK